MNCTRSCKFLIQADPSGNYSVVDSILTSENKKRYDRLRIKYHVAHRIALSLTGLKLIQHDIA